MSPAVYLAIFIDDEKQKMFNAFFTFLSLF